MEVYQTDNHYILLDGEYSLWCSRKHGTLEAKTGNDLCSAWNPVCIGLVYGLIGKIKIHPESSWKLLLISRQTCVGQLGGEHDVYQINKVVVLPLSEAEATDTELDLCKKHHFGIKRTDRITQNADGQGKSLQKTWNTLKSAAENVKPKKKEIKDKEKFERRILEELIKMYNETDSFYYCTTFDLTNCIQRQYQPDYDMTAPLWQRCDERFFWNLHMTRELTDMQTELACHWVLPVVQGCMDIQKCCLDFSDRSSDLSPHMPRPKKDPVSYTMILLSRRSRHRAGTRSKKRGLDETGACANYVETEQIIEFSHHRVSFVQVRGSIPVFWSQTGVKYRPPPKLDKGETETYDAFHKHVDEQLRIYKSVTVLTLAELAGKEKAIGDAFLDNVIKYSSQDVTYVTFDFHEYCRGMKFENVSVLTAGIKDIIKHMRYTWVDRKGMICEQRGVFRVNCVDCLDRTNVVQTAIARIVMETQCRKLGLLAPDENLPENCRKIYQQVWANTGDAISKQYAGTAALKGDFTRTGERKISGMMKDGVNSANRYYLRFKDTYRQAAIDLTHGMPVSEEILTAKLKVPEDDVREMMEKEENVKMLIEDCKKMLIVEPEECLGGWALVNADPGTGDSDRQEMDIVLMLSQRAVYVAWYDDEEEQINKYQRIFLEDVEKIEIGAEASLFKSKAVVLRLHYQHYADEGFFHTFRTPSTRLFNNIVLTVRTPEEAKEQLNVISEAFAAAQHILSINLEVEEKVKLEKKKTLPHPEVMDVHQQLQENSLSKIKLPRDISSSDIPSQASSRGASPMFEHKLSPSPLRASRKINNPDGLESGKKKKEADEVGSRGAKVKALLASMPKLDKLNKNINAKSFDLAVSRLNVKSLNLVSKIKLGGEGAGRLLSKVSGNKIFYQQVPADKQIKGKTERDVPDSAKATIQAQERVRTYSRDDSTIDESEDLTEAELQQEVVLGSCGILATNTKQILESPQYSVDVEDDDIFEDASTSGTDDEDTKWITTSAGAGVEKVLHTNVPGVTDTAIPGHEDTWINIDKEHTNADAVSTSEIKVEKNEDVDGSESQIIIEIPKSRSLHHLSGDFSTSQEDSDNATDGKEAEVIWIKRKDAIKVKERAPTSLGLNLGKSRVAENSEADKILEKYSSRDKTALSHPHMRTSLSDSAIATNQVVMSVSDMGSDSPKSVLETDFENNEQLLQKLPNLLQSAKMSKKSQKIYQGLKQRIQEKLGDRICPSTVIFL